MKSIFRTVLPGIAAVAVAALCGSASAANINGGITFTGGVTLDTGSASTATQVLTWQNTEVESLDGDFAGFVAAGDAATFTAPWTFNSGAHAALWQVGGFTFDLIGSSIAFQGMGSVIVSGTGTISGNGFDPTDGVWRFTTQNPSADGIFSFSASVESVSVPDGGLTIALLGAALSGLVFLRRRVSA